jgi:exodeoxyribonuclease VII small subunit
MSKRKASTSTTPEVSLEEAMAELSQIVTSLESGQVSLDESLARFERGMALLRVCHQKLDSAAQRIEILTQMTDNDVVTEEFDSTSTLKRTQQKNAESADVDPDTGRLFS